MFYSLQYLTGDALLAAAAIAGILFLACLSLGWRLSVTLMLAASMAGFEGRSDIFCIHLAFWCTGAIAVALLTILLDWLEKYIFHKRKQHLLLKIKEKWIAGMIASVLLALASVANLRFWEAYIAHPAGGWPVLAVICIGLVADVIGIRALRTAPNSLGMPAIIATTAVMAMMPLVASPSALLLAGMFAGEAVNREPVYQGNRAMKLVLNTAVLPAAAFLFGYIAAHYGFTASLMVIAIGYCLALLKMQDARNRRYIRRRGDYTRVIEEEVNEERRKLHEIEIDIIRKEKEHLINLLDLRRDEVRDVTEKLTDQREFMQELYNSILQAKNTADTNAKDAILHESLSRISLRLNFSDERNEINNKVEELHKDFSIRLKSKYPQLSQQECKLAALLRLEFPTKYIATVLNISPKSVEVERHRLRQKFGLNRQTKLTDFIKTI